MRLIDEIAFDEIAYREKIAKIPIEERAFVKACETAQDMPTIDAVPVVRGEWEVAIGYDPNKKVQCQNCYKMAYEPTPYCPKCGALMEDKPCGT